jgi:hypothetical protein
VCDGISLNAIILLFFNVSNSSFLGSEKFDRVLMEFLREKYL